MNPMMSSAAKRYMDIQVETGVNSASPHQLISMLYDGMLRWLNTARVMTQEGRIREKCEALTRVLAILGELRGSLNKEAGGEIAENLDRLYAYMEERLVEANVTKRLEILDELQHLTGELRSAWVAIAPA